MNLDQVRIRAWLDLSLRLAPWLAAAILVQLGISEVWSRQTQSALKDLVESRRLAAVVPNASTLQRRIDSLARDTALLGERLRHSNARILRESDPGAVLAAYLVPELGSQGWRLQRVRAEAKEGWAVLDLGAEADFNQILSGLDKIRRSTRALRIRRLAIRPLPHGRLAIDIQVASPAEVVR
ncbi:MAG: hypothetical protein IPN71_03125 [Fibrobacteres bacterium]|nr:hypothetical protein [Fibrobacterota bacterium]